MLILSQNKQVVAPIETGTLAVENKSILINYSWSSYNLGEYSTEKRATEVLNSILDEYRRYLYTEGGVNYTVPGIVQAFGFIPPKVFEMPEE